MQNPTRQKRQSCEACRTRKLKCSGYAGERRSCTRCLALNVVCHYQDKGIPGRSRKQRGDLREESSRASRGPREARESSEARRFAFAPSPPVTDSSSTGSIDGSNDEGQSHPPLQTAAAHQAHRLGVDSLFLQPLSFPLFPPSSDALPTTLPDPSSSSADFAFDPFPIELFGQCPLVRHHHSGEETPTATLSPPQSPHSSPQSPATLSCHCADDVSASVRALRHRAQAVSHAIVGDLRVGIDLVERLLTCPICYDIKKGAAAHD
ncbi:hypothetical protein SPBR_08618 [Sporothrix brasiliensis 5110]|uniref:Zn(2)-C6 fungal-type domain-containing protein n=1 Tax=Sporothrix brasiliensis 5110 TaxID=1398154 RepID=A0A0C2IP62_9PEZI|nr:uncharacterized protein SPBR_08618 [Sporothrix brasiliensis 5110]KIH86867.1 hypothetical protein SPBR_08618 [Sporothrix brasiliensis 5110]